MKIINYDEIIKRVTASLAKMNFVQDEGIRQAIDKAKIIETEGFPLAVLGDLQENAQIAAAENIPLCQDTGIVVAFVEIGNIRLDRGNISDAINEGVRAAYTAFGLRKSIVSDPFIRENTGDNTPAVIHYDIRSDESLVIHLAAKGIGSENMSAARMMTPASGIDGVINFVSDTIAAAGATPCPPIIVGVGVGGTIEKAALLAKKSLFRNLGEPNSLPHIASIEQQILNKVNSLGIGPMGLGGNTTAFAVHVEVFPTHIGGLPVVVNINCHCSRHETLEF